MTKSVQSHWRAVYNGIPVTLKIVEYKNYYTCDINAGSLYERKTFTTREEFEQFLNSLHDLLPRH